MASPLCGYHGRYLLIDLSQRRFFHEPLSEEVLRSYIGGVGLGTWLMLQHTPSGCHSDAPEAPLAIVFSPLVGTPLTTSAKFAVLCPSPLTERLNDALASSHFALAGKRTGVDALVVRGRAARPCVLLVDESGVRIEDAEGLRGLPASETEAAVRERWGQDCQVAAIGPAGENGVRYATLSHDGRHAGRGGTGAFLGSKNVKAIAVRGSARAAVFDRHAVVRLSRELSRRSLGETTAKYRELGTITNLVTFNRLGVLPVRGFGQTTFRNAEAFSPERLQAAFQHVRTSCAACTIGCEHMFRPREDDSSPVRLEYENLFALGPLCGVEDPETVARASQLCDRFGLDTISTGVTIAFAMECAERGWWDAFPVRFGDGAGVLELIELIARRDGVGALLAEGTRRLARLIGPQTEQIAPHVKGLELPGYDPRSLQTLALGFAVAARGADHNRSGAYQADFSPAVDRFRADERSVRQAIETEDEAAIMDSLILCKFVRHALPDRWEDFAAMLAAVTGWNVTATELRNTARRIIDAKKRFNIRLGWTPAEDRLPERFYSEPIPDGPAAGAVIDRQRFEELIREYYRLRGWSEDGYPAEDAESAAAPASEH